MGFILHTAICQNITHDGGFRSAGLIRIASGQDQMRFRVFFQVFLGRVQPRQEITRRPAVFQGKAEHDGVVSRASGVHETAADHFAAEEHNHQNEKKQDYTQNPARDEEDRVPGPGEEVEADVKREQKKDTAEDELVQEQFLIIRLQDNAIDFVKHDDNHVDGEKDHQKEQDVTRREGMIHTISVCSGLNLRLVLL